MKFLISELAGKVNEISQALLSLWEAENAVYLSSPKMEENFKVQIRAARPDPASFEAEVAAFLAARQRPDGWLFSRSEDRGINRNGPGGFKCHRCGGYLTAVTEEVALGFEVQVQIWAKRKELEPVIFEVGVGLKPISEGVASNRHYFWTGHYPGC